MAEVQVQRISLSMDLKSTSSSHLIPVQSCCSDDFLEFHIKYLKFVSTILTASCLNNILALKSTALGTVAAKYLKPPSLT